jgi:hypothetical protein
MSRAGVVRSRACVFRFSRPRLGTGLAVGDLAATDPDPAAAEIDGPNLISTDSADDLTHDRNLQENSCNPTRANGRLAMVKDRG